MSFFFNHHHHNNNNKISSKVQWSCRQYYTIGVCRSSTNESRSIHHDENTIGISIGNNSFPRTNHILFFFFSTTTTTTRLATFSNRMSQSLARHARQQSMHGLWGTTPRMGDGQFWRLGMHTMQWHTQKLGSTNVHRKKHHHGSLDGTTSIENVGGRKSTIGIVF